MSVSFRAGLLSLLASVALTAMAQSPTQTFTYSGFYDFMCGPGPQGCPVSMNPQWLDTRSRTETSTEPSRRGLESGDVGAVLKLHASQGGSPACITFGVGRGTACTDGAGPTAGVIEGKAMEILLWNHLVGRSAQYGGLYAEYFSYGCGTVFKLTPAGNAHATLHSFARKAALCSDGYDPVTSLVEGRMQQLLRGPLRWADAPAPLKRAAHFSVSRRPELSPPSILSAIKPTAPMDSTPGASSSGKRWQTFMVLPHIQASQLKKLN